MPAPIPARIRQLQQQQPQSFRTMRRFEEQPQRNDPELGFGGMRNDHYAQQEEELDNEDQGYESSSMYYPAANARYTGSNKMVMPLAQSM